MFSHFWSDPSMCFFLFRFFVWLFKFWRCRLIFSYVHGRKFVFLLSHIFYVFSSFKHLLWQRIRSIFIWSLNNRVFRCSIVDRLKMIKVIIWSLMCFSFFKLSYCLTFKSCFCCEIFLIHFVTFLCVVQTW